MNLGSPDSTETKDVKRYLDEFLMDERVIDKPYLLRALLVKGIITPFRAAKSAEAYKTIWWKEGSPLIELTKRLQKAVQQNFDEPVEIAMRYGNPTPKEAYDKLIQEHPGIEEVILFPLYPHYAMSSYETAVEYMKEVHAKYKYPFKLTTVAAYYNNADYINALAESMKAPSLFLHVLGLALVAGRYVHAYTLSQTPHILRLRVLGMWATLTMIGLTAMLCFVLAGIDLLV